MQKASANPAGSRVVVAIRPIHQFTPADCGMACLAMIANLPYEQVFETAARLGFLDKAKTRGFYDCELLKVAASLGVVFRRRRMSSVDEGTDGILSVRPLKGHGGHYVVLFHGIIICPTDGCIWNFDAYLDTSAFRATSLLELVSITKS